MTNLDGTQDLYLYELDKGSHRLSKSVLKGAAVHPGWQIYQGDRPPERDVLVVPPKRGKAGHPRVITIRGYLNKVGHLDHEPGDAAAKWAPCPVEDPEFVPGYLSDEDDDGKAAQALLAALRRRKEDLSRWLGETNAAIAALEARKEE